MSGNETGQLRVGVNREQLGKERSDGCVQLENWCVRVKMTLYSRGTPSAGLNQVDFGGTKSSSTPTSAAYSLIFSGIEIEVVQEQARGIWSGAAAKGACTKDEEPCDPVVYGDLYASKQLNRC